MFISKSNGLKILFVLIILFIFIFFIFKKFVFLDEKNTVLFSTDDKNILKSFVEKKGSDWVLNKSNFMSKNMNYNDTFLYSFFKIYQPNPSYVYALNYEDKYHVIGLMLDETSFYWLNDTLNFLSEEYSFEKNGRKYILLPEVSSSKLHFISGKRFIIFRNIDPDKKILFVFFLPEEYDNMVIFVEEIFPFNKTYFERNFDLK